MSAQPANPQPAEDYDSMLSRKFGKEVANYFSGSPLNRVGFLRGDHKFLTAALHHPSTQFLLCNELQPLVSPDDKSRLQYVKYADIKTVIGENPYASTEAEMIGMYDSKKYVPQMIFLGIDEKAKEALSYQGKNMYKGAPYFAVDVTPMSSVKEECEKLIQQLGGKGLTWAKGRVMEIAAEDGMYTNPPIIQSRSHDLPILPTPSRAKRTAPADITRSGHLRRSPPTPRLERPQPLLRPMRPAHPLRQRRLQAYLPSERSLPHRRPLINGCLQRPRFQPRRCRDTDRRRRLGASAMRDPEGHLQLVVPSDRPDGDHGRSERQRR